MRTVVTFVLVLALVVGQTGAAQAADPVTVAANGGSMIIETRAANGAKVLTHYSMSGARIVGGPTRPGFTARHGALATPKARVALAATRASSGVIGLAALTGEVVFMAYRSANPPPDWDWASGDDPRLGEGAQVGAEPHLDGAYNPETTTSSWVWSGSAPLAEKWPGFPETTPPSLKYVHLSSELPGGLNWGDYVSTIGGTAHGTWVGTRMWGNNGEVQVVRSSGRPSHMTRIERAGNATRPAIYSHGMDRMELVVRANQSDPWIVLATVVPPGGIMPDVTARVVGEAQCQDEPQYGDTVRTYTNESGWYSDHSDRPTLPTVGCPSTTFLVGADYYVEYSDGSRQYIIGGPADHEDREGQQPRDPRTGSASTFFSFVPNPAPSEVPTEDVDLWDACHDPSSGVTCDLELHNTEDQRRATVHLDFGWQWQRDREERYECRLIHPVGGAMLVHLDECLGFAWTGESEAPTAVPVEVPVPDDGEDPEAPPALLPPPTPTGDPPGAPAPRSDCLGARREGDGISSWLVFAGAACALEWAFSPSQQTAATLADARDGIVNKPPMGYLTSGANWLQAFGDLPESNECWQIAVPVEGYGEYPVADTCGSHPVTDRITDMRPLLAVVLYGSFIAPLVWWGWRTYAPGAGGST